MATRVDDDGHMIAPENKQEKACLTVTARSRSEIIHVVGKGQDSAHNMNDYQNQNGRDNLSSQVKITRLAPWEYHLDTNLFEFDDEFYIIYGTNVEREGRFMARDVYAMEFVHPDDVWIVEAARARALACTERYLSGQFEQRIIRRDGEVRTIIVRSTIIRDATGNIIKWFGANQDITEQKVMEEAFRASREKLSLAVELARLGPWEFHTATGLFEFGDEFYAIYGTDVAREGAFMTPDVYAREFVHPDDVWIVAAEMEKALLTTERRYIVEVEHRIIRRDGEVRTIIVRMSYIRDEHGKLIKRYGANQDITERKAMEEALRQKNEQIRHMAYTDVLTGLSNRAHVNERLEEELEKARRSNSSGVVLFIDLDDLKTVNDTLGHSYGDILITETGKRIVEKIGNGAVVGRIGGDEFVVILPGARTRKSINRIVDSIIAALYRDIVVYGETIHISASAGVAIYPDDGNTVEEIFKNADNAMYAAKNAGKNCWRFYDSHMQEVIYEKMLLTKCLRYAIQRKELLLHYQPLVAVVDGMTAGFEALLRWNSREHGSVSPARFIPLAEQCGLIQPIGTWVLREACKFARRLADKGWKNIYVAVNISPHQLCADGFVDSVRKALKNAGIQPHQIELEITETVLIVSLKESIGRLHELRAMGIRLALDDFGTGYSSLTYLQRLPVTTLKIDKSFVDMILADGKQKAIIGTIIDLAHAMDMSVVAEGVETREQIDYLVQCHCDILQGYVISRPKPEAEAVQFAKGIYLTF